MMHRKKAVIPQYFVNFSTKTVGFSKIVRTFAVNKKYFQT